MEVLPCSGARNVGESDCPEQRSQAAFKHDGKSDCLQDEEQVRTDLKVEGLTLNIGESLQVREDGGQFILEGFPASEGVSNGDTFDEFDLDSQNLSSYSHDSEDDHLEKRDNFEGPGLTLESSHLVLDTSESGLLNSNQESSSHTEIKALEQDEPQAVWVKWRGKWQSGIRCARADWPLSTVKAKPTHDRKQYLVIFFPRTRNYSWADVLLVRPINEFPEPIAYKTHKVGIKMVKDLTLARRFIMQKLAVSMLNILDQLNREALVETARDVVVLKEFAMEASRCKDYSDLGRMLLKLQNMILQSCLTSDWLHQSMESWKQRCQDANTAECIEMLKEELADSILWNEVNLLSASQGDLGSEWKSWKHEVMKWFSVSHPISAAVGLDQSINESPSSMGLQITRKRPKLEVRRADTHVSSSHQSVPVETDSTFFNGYGAVNTASLDSESLKKNDAIEGPAQAGSPSRVANKWNDIVVEAGNSDVIENKDVELTPTTVVTQKSMELGNHNRQCIAFIEAKGRQCVRYANEGDVYCCVHLASRFVANSAKAEATPSIESPMCGGTTVLGTKCKHRALIGSSFCKKHRPLDGKKMTAPVNKLKRKNEEHLMYPESKTPTKFLLARNDEVPVCADPLLDAGTGSVQESSISEKPDQPQQAHGSDEMVQCIGSWPHGGEEHCQESPKRHSLYCEKHLPSWLKRARNGKSRIVSKEVFIELLKNCPTREQKLQLHQACELFYKLFKSILSLRNPVPKDVQFQWAITEASKDIRVGEFLMKLVGSEKERLKKLWGFGESQTLQASLTNEELVPIPMQTSNDRDHENVIKCKICLEKFLDDQALGTHWMESHKKEAQWLFRGYVCAICLDSFTNKKVLEAHVQERHHVQFVEQCKLLQCIPCGNHFGNPDQLWSHVLSIHPSNLRLPNVAQQQAESSWQKVEPSKTGLVKDTKSENQLVNRRYICRFCGLKFDLLPDLGRHHQAAHMGQNPTGPRLTKKGIQFYAHKLKSGRLTRPRFKKSLNSASYKIRNRSVQNLKKRIQASNSIGPVEIMIQPTVPETATLGRLADSQCSAIAKILISEIRKTKSKPSNSEILSIASSACCTVSLQAVLEDKYGNLPERLYLKAARLCSEHNILVEWHQDGFICPKGCTPSVRSPILCPLVPSTDNSFKARSSFPSHPGTSEWTMDECHCVIDSRHFSLDLSEKNIVLCDDISFGQESVPIACVVDENLLNSEAPDGQMTEYSFPWESFTYVTKPLVDQSLVLESESLQLGCSCAHSTCSSETCDHVYLFDNDYEDAKDIYGNPIHGRSPYDERGRIILEEGYLVYECNQRCHCSRDCRNRVLQNGVQVKLEIFKTEKKIIYLSSERDMHDKLTSEVQNYDYEKANCYPNLVNHQVLVESMDSQLAHIGFYASRDIALGEELTYDFQYKLLPGEGCLCLCGASSCRGRLY
ncbi:histone H3 (Lys9) methyltransferase SUV39H1/Clr4, required for transcriptional silencing [Handroanthus impetiginosus]|uniref:Histone H3 (Lys9) methyltransferase SUV39H1/Clr4, required for transcriptional silencing n=1 Tax=Handroanthus impetiginosus TaxID=429701 RepID=A0A2G9HVH4_9LAMI|nr:histone H3 (Lys9) methyltransferase SUV39H1/Clr4, required for transcriptional silencing [Handroanthus impetiginosus]